jgi:hypothetical protein
MRGFMKTFFVLILIKFKLITFSIGNGKDNFESNIKSIFVKEFQNVFNSNSFNRELIETKKSEHDSIPTIPEKSDIYFSLLFEHPIWAYSSQLDAYQQLYRLYSNFRF